MGYIQAANTSLEALIDGKPFNPPTGGPGGKGSPNMVLNALAIAYILELRRPRLRKRPAREALLAVLQAQANPDPERLQGIGVVRNGFEQSPGDHHRAYHVTPVAAAALLAVRHHDRDVLHLCLAVLGLWYASWREGDLLGDGTVVLPMTRAWPFRYPEAQLNARKAPDGMIHLPLGGTFFAAGDAAYRLLAGKPQIDNKGEWHDDPAWIVKRKGLGMGMVRGLYRLEESGASVPRDLPVALAVPMRRSEHQDGGVTVKRLWLAQSEAEITARIPSRFIQGLAPAVEVRGREIAWSPHIVPEGFTTGP